MKRITFRAGEPAAVEFWPWTAEEWDRWMREDQAVTLVPRHVKEAMIGDD